MTLYCVNSRYVQIIMTAYTQQISFYTKKSFGSMPDGCIGPKELKSNNVYLSRVDLVQSTGNSVSRLTVVNK